MHEGGVREKAEGDCAERERDISGRMCYNRGAGRLQQDIRRVGGVECKAQVTDSRRCARGVSVDILSFSKSHTSRLLDQDFTAQAVVQNDRVV